MLTLPIQPSSSPLCTLGWAGWNSGHEVVEGTWERLAMEGRQYCNYLNSSNLLCVDPEAKTGASGWKVSRGKLGLRVRKSGHCPGRETDYSFPVAKPAWNGEWRETYGCPPGMPSKWGLHG